MSSRKHHLSCLLLPVLLLGLAGCGSVSVNGAAQPTPTPTPSPGMPTPTPTPTPTATPTPTPVALMPSRFVYGIIDFEAEGFFGGRINSGTGQVTPISGNPVANPLGQNIVVQMLADPKGRFLYALDIGASSFGIQFGQIGIAAFQINRSSGVLTQAQQQIVFPVQRFAQMAIDGTGRFLYQPDGSSIDVYSINQSNGQLTLMPGVTPAPTVGNFSAASSDGRFLFNEGNVVGSGFVEVYGINAANGQLATATTPMATGGSGGPMAVSADNRFLYVANSAQGTVAVFSIGSNGALTLMAGSPFATDTDAGGMSLSPDGKFLYITFQTDTENHVKGFAVNPAAGIFTPIAGATVANANSINVDGSGKFAYVSQTQLVTYRIDPVTGALTQASQAAQPVTDIPSDIVLTP
jgi:6-phosphogluconolactonase (cycloisomerase 2 family)